jgi:hypothetical protein
MFAGESEREKAVSVCEAEKEGRASAARIRRLESTTNQCCCAHFVQGEFRALGAQVSMSCRITGSHRLVISSAGRGRRGARVFHLSKPSCNSSPEAGTHTTYLLLHLLLPSYYTDFPSVRLVTPPPLTNRRSVGLDFTRVNCPPSSLTCHVSSTCV